MISSSQSSSFAITADVTTANPRGNGGAEGKVASVLVSSCKLERSDATGSRKWGIGARGWLTGGLVLAYICVTCRLP